MKEPENYMEKYAQEIAKGVNVIISGTLRGRRGFSKVLKLLYSSLYDSYKLSDADLKYIINYVMEEYTR